MMDNPQIYSALCAAMDEIGAIGKDSHNSQQNFNYRGVDAVMNSLQPVLIKNHIFVIPEVLEQTREERTTAKGNTLLYSILKMKYTFYAEDGSGVSAVVIGEGMDSGDKASNKAMSVAFKYACFQVLCIPTEEMKDPDADTPPESTQKQIICPECGKPITKGVKYKGQSFNPEQLYKTFGRCADCLRKQIESEKAAQ